MMVDEPILDEAEPTLMEVSAPTWHDIDELDHCDPQAVTTYVEEIYDNCRQKEVRSQARKRLFRRYHLRDLPAPPTFSPNFPYREIQFRIAKLVEVATIFFLPRFFFFLRRWIFL